LSNSIVYYNNAPTDANCATNIVALGYSCTIPLPTNHLHCITNEPLLIDLTSGNLRLQPNSPCINAGYNSAVLVSPDLNGQARIAGGTVDIGAYEFQSPASLISYAWLQGYGLPADGSADYEDTDSDGMNNWQEWRAGTVPLDALSVLKMFVPSSTASGLALRWQSVSGVNYFLQRGTNPASPGFVTLQSDIVGQPGTTTCTDSNAVGAGPFIYRVGVQ
jgi:hypothetical protein